MSNPTAMGYYIYPFSASLDDCVHLGLFPAATCVNRTNTWQAYECAGPNVDHEMMIIESMDADTETRRLSPVAVISER